MSRDWFYQPPVNFIRRSQGFRMDLVRLSDWARLVTDACVEEDIKFNIISWDRRLGLVDHQKASFFKFGGPLWHATIRAGVSPSLLIPQHDEYQYFKGDTSHPKCDLSVLLTRVLVEFSRAWDAEEKAAREESRPMNVVIFFKGQHKNQEPGLKSNAPPGVTSRVMVPLFMVCGKNGHLLTAQLHYMLDEMMDWVASQPPAKRDKLLNSAESLSELHAELRMAHFTVSAGHRSDQRVTPIICKVEVPQFKAFRSMLHDRHPGLNLLGVKGKPHTEQVDRLFTSYPSVIDVSNHQ
jgi:hypothetical protein